MAKYRNTLTVDLWGIHLARPPRGTLAGAWDQLRAAYPQLDGARVHEDTGGHLQVEVERTMYAYETRHQVVEDLAVALGAEVASYVDAGPPRMVTHYLTASYAGVTVVVSTRLCECHDGQGATLGVFRDLQDIVAEVTGEALREIIPPEHHGTLAAAETVVDAELALRSEQP
jgi:hypothetical protein